MAPEEAFPVVSLCLDELIMSSNLAKNKQTATQMDNIFKNTILEKWIISKLYIILGIFSVSREDRIMEEMSIDAMHQNISELKMGNEFKWREGKGNNKTKFYI